MTDIRAEKIALRDRLSSERLALSADALRAASAAVCRHAGALSQVARASRIALYAAMRGEIDVALIGSEARARGGEVYYPRIARTEPPTLAFHRVELAGALTPGRFGVKAPPETAPVCALAEIALVIVPGVAFDRSGHRLGYGGGYYDAALAAAPPALRIGVCHSFQLVDALPRREADEPVDVIVTPDGALATFARPAILVEGLS
ncbi:MAG TPA: 5-formyltetrahydrofolate cyclo-ligase [Polyangia bacterium]